MEKVLNWGVLGCSNIANQVVVPAIKAAYNAKLYAISEEFAKERLEPFKKNHQPVKAYDSYDMLLDDPQIDAVHIPLPNSLHCEWVIKAAKKKKHILCEKPLACNPKQIQMMFEACQENSVKLMEAFAYRHSPVIRKAKELADSGVVGKIKLIECYFAYNMSNLKDIRLQRKLGGGATYDVGCYNLNFIRYIAGKEPISTYSVGEIGKESNVDENVITVLDFGDGLTGISHAAFNCGFRNEYRIIGDNGIIEALDGFNAEGALKITIKKDDDFFIRGRNYQDIVVDGPDNYMLEIEQFGRYVLEGEPPLITQADSCQNALLVDQILDQVYKGDKPVF